MVSEKIAREITVSNGFDVTLQVPSSGSISNRALLIAALADGECRVERPARSRYVEVMADAIASLGGSVQWQGDSVLVQPIPASVDSIVPVWCGEVAAVVRFLAPVVAALRANVVFDGTDSLRARPMGPLMQALKEQGSQVAPVAAANRVPFSVRGNGLRGGPLEIDGSVSSQFLSGLLIAAPFAREALQLRATDLVSRSYIDLTLAVMSAFGAEVATEDNGVFRVQPSGRYRASAYSVEADASSAAYFFAAAAVTGSRVRVTNVRRDSGQGEMRFLEILESMGARVVEDGNGVVVEGNGLVGGEFDLRDMPDVVTTLACMAPFAQGPTRLRNIDSSRFKESDRIAAVVSGFDVLGIRSEVEGSDLVVYPITDFSQVRGGVVQTFGDDRVAMAFAIMGLRIPGVVIDDITCTARTFPNFFDLWQGLYDQRPRVEL